MHAPAPLHTMFELQDVPGVLLVALSTQTDDPVEHEVVPTLHGFGFVVHPARSGVHELQVPPLQNWVFVVLHADPSASGVPRSVHTAVPVAQDSIPLWQGLEGVQAVPLLHATHAPALQTIPPVPAPQVIPLGLFPLSTQAGDPVEQEIVPVLQVLPG